MHGVFLVSMIGMFHSRMSQFNESKFGGIPLPFVEISQWDLIYFTRLSPRCDFLFCRDSGPRPLVL